ncbi:MULTISPECIES: CaiB/BaiF CoA transferase family protein [Actinomadura]|uniref:CoA transferase n=1 Tax=Actinomadura miaoliensis TaxID=430685 RepID=A0ABP7VDJ7_9ACTN
MTNDPVFSGVKVLDIASYIAGPAAATVLADFGADVVKVEPPGTGDPQRRLAFAPPNPRAEANYAWHLTNRDKRGMAVDLKSPGGTRILERLVTWADVLVTNYPHAVRTRLHLTYDEVAAWNPRIVYADFTGFGNAGPDAALPGFDMTAYWARSGLLAMTRDADAPPTLPVEGSGDYVSAMGLYSAIVTGLYHRERTGRGTCVGTSLLAHGVWATGTLVSGALAGGEFYGLHDRRESPNPLINLYATADDRWLMLVVAAPRWPRLANAIGRPELLEDPRFTDVPRITENSRALTRILDEVFAGRPLADWKRVFDQARITYGAVQTPQEAAADPQLEANDIVVPLEGVERLDSTISSPITVHASPKTPPRRAPGLGEHNDEVLTELGFSPDEVADFRSSGAIPPAAAGTS